MRRSRRKAVPIPSLSMTFAARFLATGTSPRMSATSTSAALSRLVSSAFESSQGEEGVDDGSAAQTAPAESTRFTVPALPMPAPACEPGRAGRVVMCFRTRPSRPIPRLALSFPMVLTARPPLLTTRAACRIESRRAIALLRWAMPSTAPPSSRSRRLAPARVACAHRCAPPR